MIELPANITHSRILTKQQLALLSNVDQVPAVDPSFEDATLKNIFQYYSLTPDEMEDEVHQYAAELLTKGKVDEAWQVLLTTTEM